MSYREEIINQINSMTDEELEQSMVLPDEEIQEGQVLDDRLVDLEIEKENRRVRNERSFDIIMSKSSSKLHKDSYRDGFAIGLKYAGIYQALLQAGMSTDNAYQITLNESTINGNIEIAKVSNENNAYNLNVIGFQEENPYDNYEGEE